MEIAHFLVNLLILFFQALNAGKTNACCAIISVMMLFIIPMLVGLLISNRKLVRGALYCEIFLFCVFLAIAVHWLLGFVIMVAVTYYYLIRNFPIATLDTK